MRMIGNTGNIVTRPTNLSVDRNASNSVYEHQVTAKWKKLMAH